MIMKPTYEELEQKVKELEKKVFNGEQEYRKSFKDICTHAPIGLILTDANSGKILDVNDKLLRITGYCKEDLLHQNVCSLYKNPDDRKILIEQMRDYRFVRDLEVEFKRKNGKTYNAKLNVNPITIEGENGFLASIEDITDRVQAEKALRESEEKFRTIFTNSSDGIIVADPETKKFIYVNPAICRILDYTEEELTQMGVFDIHPKNSLEHVVSEFEAQAGGEKHLALNIPFLKKDGTIIYMDTNASIVKMNKESRIMGVFRDITDRKRAEEALQESELKYKTLTENSLAGIYIHQDDKYVFVNDRFAEMVGYSPDELLEKNHYDLAHPDQREMIKQRAYKRLAGEKVPKRYEIVKLRKNGEAVLHEIMDSEPINYQGRPAIMGHEIDISKRKQAEEMLKQAKEELEQRVAKRTAELRTANESLEIQTKNLEEVNTALRVLLNKRDQDKIEFEEKVLYNVKELIFPYLDKLDNTTVDDTQRAFLGILESNLNDIISSFSRNLSQDHIGLTPSEIEVANLIRQGKTTKQIAFLFTLSSRTIETHRRNIRKKLGLENAKINLSTYLKSMQ